VKDIGSIVVGIAVGLAWLVLWGYFLGALGFPLLRRKGEDQNCRRERLKRMGKTRYVLLFGVLGSGLAFGLAMTVADYAWRDPLQWFYELSKLVFLSVVFGLFQGLRNWSEFRDPVPFPPEYPPARNPAPFPPNYPPAKMTRDA